MQSSVKVMQRIKLCCFNQCWCKFSVEPYLCINKTLICAEAYDSQVLIDLELQKLNTSSEPCLSFEFEKRNEYFTFLLMKYTSLIMLHICIFQLPFSAVDLSFVEENTPLCIHVPFLGIDYSAKMRPFL